MPVLVMSVRGGVPQLVPEIVPPAVATAFSGDGGVRLDPMFDDMVANRAEKLGVDRRSLRSRTLLHLPRVADVYGAVRDDLLERELDRATEQLRRDLDAAADRIPTGRFALTDLRFERIPQYKADALLGRLHYLRSSSPGSLNLALLDPVHHLPVSICSVSPLQWRRVASRIRTRFGVPRERVLDVSRVYSCENAPPNAISLLLSRVRRELTSSPYDLLTTSVDTNLGFTGASYRSTNWQHWLTVRPRPYLYRDEEYVSPRQLRREYGSSSIAELQAANPAKRFEVSRVPLRNSLIFASRLRGETERASTEDRRPVHR